MKIRNGNYTIYKGIEMEIYSVSRPTVTIPDERELYKWRILSYPFALGKQKGFEKHPHTGDYYKEILVSELSNAFNIVTNADFKGITLKVYNFFEAEKSLGLTTYDFIGDSNFVQSIDDYGRKYYIGMVDLSEIEKIWEERTKSNFDLPMPEGIESKKTITPTL